MNVMSCSAICTASRVGSGVKHLHIVTSRISQPRNTLRNELCGSGTAAKALAHASQRNDALSLTAMQNRHTRNARVDGLPFDRASTPTGRIRGAAEGRPGEAD